MAAEKFYTPDDEGVVVAPDGSLRINGVTVKSKEKQMKRKKEHAETMLRSNREYVSERGAKSPIIGANGFDISEDDNSKYIAVTAEIFNAPDIDMNDPVAVQERLSWYFELMAKASMKPTVAGMGLALNGMDKQRLYDIKSDRFTHHEVKRLRPDVRGIIKKAYKFLESLHESYMNGGKVNPVTGIFLAKNHFAYTDKTEHIVTPNTNTEEIVDVEEIKKRYIEEK